VDGLATTVKEFFEKMPSQFQSSKAGQMTATYQFDITGEGGGKWFATIEKGALTVGEGQAEKPNITLTVSGKDWMDIASGKLDGQMAFLTGKLKIAGDMSLAMKLKSLFFA
jgi:putative sterol carrier protein